MVSVFDVAKYILEQQGDMTAMKLQKLVYYAQVWSLVWDEDVLFHSPIQAWANGPVVPDLFYFHRGHFKVGASDFSHADTENLSEKQKETIDQVLAFYGSKPAQWLSELTHRELPWKNAREGLEPLERGNNEIALDDMADYYGTLAIQGDTNQKEEKTCR